MPSLLRNNMCCCMVLKVCPTPFQVKVKGPSDLQGYVCLKTEKSKKSIFNKRSWITQLMSKWVWISQLSKLISCRKRWIVFGFLKGQMSQFILLAMQAAWKMWILDFLCPQSSSDQAKCVVVLNPLTNKQACLFFFRKIVHPTRFY